MKRAIAAFLLSLLEPGLGQVYNRQFGKAILLLVLLPLSFSLGGVLHLLHTFHGMLLWIAIVWGITLFAIVDAVRTARVASEVTTRPPMKSRMGIAALALALAGLMAQMGGLYTGKLLGVRVLKIPTDSMSMAPTLVSGDRFISDNRAYLWTPPKRQELVLVRENPPSTTFFIKRVIGVAGDTVTVSNEGMSVNGSRLREPYVKAPIPLAPELADGDEVYKVPPGQFFVLGDNRGDSWDSRFAEFGSVSITRIAGKPLYIYYSKDHRRIGQRLQ